MSLSIALEGPEGSGKTSQQRVVAHILEKMLGLPVLLVREPGGTDLGEEVRDILTRYNDMHPRTSVLLFSAVRNELILKEILPWLKENPNGISIGDRCWQSTFAHQLADGADEDYIRETQKPFIEVYPNKFVFTDLHPQEIPVRMERAKRMGEKRKWWRDYVDLETASNIRGKYLEMVREYRDRTLLLDGFTDPATRAFETAFFILGKEKNPLIFTPEVKSELLKVWQEGTGLNYDELSKQEEEVRKEMGAPERELLRAEIHNDWKRLGLESPQVSLERER